MDKCLGNRTYHNAIHFFMKGFCYVLRESLEELQLRVNDEQVKKDEVYSLAENWNTKWEEIWF